MSGLLVATGVVAIVVGALLVFIGIRGLRRWMTAFDSSLVTEMSCAQTFQDFMIPTDGVFDIWIKGPRFRVNPLIDSDPEVRPAAGSTPLPLRGSIFRTNMTRGSTNVMKIAGFRAQRGPHVIRLVPLHAAAGSIGARLGRSIARRMHWPAASPADCYLQVRSSDQTTIEWLSKGLLPIIVGAIGTIGGVIAVALSLTLGTG